MRPGELAEHGARVVAVGSLAVEPAVEMDGRVDAERRRAGGVHRSRLALGVAAHERDRVGVGWVVLHVRRAHHRERDPQLLENRAALWRGRGEDEPRARRRLRSGDDVELGHVAQPCFFATQISSAGHLRAHSAENVS